MDTIVLATNNKGKIKELSVMLEPFGVTVKSLSEFPEIGEDSRNRRYVQGKCFNQVAHRG